MSKRKRQRIEGDGENIEIELVERDETNDEEKDYVEKITVYCGKLQRDNVKLRETKDSYKRVSNAYKKAFDEEVEKRFLIEKNSTQNKKIKDSLETLTIANMTSYREKINQKLSKKENDEISYITSRQRKNNFQ